MTRSKSLLYIAYVAFIAIGTKSSLLNIAWERIEETFDRSLDSLALVLAFSMLGYMVSSFISGKILSKLRMGPFLLIGSLLAMTGSLGYVVTPTWILLLLATLVGSAGSGVLDAGLNTFVSAHYTTGQLNWLHAFFGVGTTLGPFVVRFTVLELGQSWRLSYLAISVMLFSLSLVLAASMRHWGVTSDANAPELTQLKMGTRATLTQPIMLLSIMLFFLYGGVEIGTAQLANSLFIEGRGISEDVSSTWVSVYWGSFTVGRMLMGIVADRINRNRLMRMSMAAMVIGALMFWSNLFGIFGFWGVVVLGFGLAPMFPTLISQTPRRIGIAHAPNAIGIQIAVTVLGGALLPGVAGILADQLGFEIIGAMIAASAMIVLLLHEMILSWDNRQAVVAAGVSD